MARLSTPKAGLAIGSSVVAAVAMAASSGGIFGEDGIFDQAACLILLLFLLLLAYIWFVVCYKQCDVEEQVCRDRCVHRYITIVTILIILFVLCMLGADFL